MLAMLLHSQSFVLVNEKMSTVNIDEEGSGYQKEAEVFKKYNY